MDAVKQVHVPSHENMSLKVVYAFFEKLYHPAGKSFCPGAAARTKKKKKPDSKPPIAAQSAAS
jgi:hypothetical protein